jgi:multidrug resistance protein MdtO
MATIAQSAAELSQTPWQWFRNFLVQELAPYRGRGSVVTRMTIAATLMMLWIMTYRIPGAALGAYYTLLFARDSVYATARSAFTSIAAVGCSLVFLLTGAILMSGEPFLHFIWVAGTLFATFFLISSLTEYRAGTAFGFLAVNTLTAWDFPANTETLVEGTLWTALAIGTAAAVTVGVEFVAQSIRSQDQFVERVDDRLRVVEDLLRCLAEGCKVSKETSEKLAQFATTGTGGLRRLLLRSNLSQQYVAEMSALVALTGRLIDLSANFNSLPFPSQQHEKPRLTRAANNLSALRALLAHKEFGKIAKLDTSADPASFGYFVSDIESNIARIAQVFAGGQSLTDYLPSATDLDRPRRIFKADAFSSPIHLRFALRGTLAAIFCYVIYNAIEWRGLSTAVSTCMITALSNVGSSRQKQVLRVTGAILGGVGIGMAAQIFVLPHIDGIGGFTLLFVCVTAAASWIATASPRLSYAGVQTAFAFYVTHLRAFGPQVSLAVARDDVVGILLGLAAMWLLFDQIWTKDALTEMMDTFVANMRRIAAFDKQLTRDDLRTAIDRSRAQRAAINNSFDQIRSESDAVIFEFGPGRPAKLRLRNHVRAWQPQLRTYFLLQVALLQYRLQSPNRLLNEKTEQHVQRSEDLLATLVDWVSRYKEHPANFDFQPIRGCIARAEEQLHSDRPGATEDIRGPLKLSHSMLEVAVSLGKQMLNADR